VGRVEVRRKKLEGRSWNDEVENEEVETRKLRRGS
jgi:hypothetical protein